METKCSHRQDLSAGLRRYVAAISVAGLQLRHFNGWRSENCFPPATRVWCLCFFISWVWHGEELRVLIVTPAASICFSACCIFSAASAFGDPRGFGRATHPVPRRVRWPVWKVTLQVTTQVTQHTNTRPLTVAGPRRHTIFSQSSLWMLPSRLHVCIVLSVVRTWMWVTVSDKSALRLPHSDYLSHPEIF